MVNVKKSEPTHCDRLWYHNWHNILPRSCGSSHLNSLRGRNSLLLPTVTSNCARSSLPIFRERSIRSIGLDMECDLPLLDNHLRSTLFTSFLEHLRPRKDICPIRRARMAQCEIGPSLLNLKAASPNSSLSSASKQSNTRQIFPIHIINAGENLDPLIHNETSSKESQDVDNRIIIEIEDDNFCPVSESERTVDLTRKSLLRAKSKSQQKNEVADSDTTDLYVVEEPSHANANSNNLKPSQTKSHQVNTNNRSIRSTRGKENLIGGANKCHLPPDDAVLMLDDISLDSSTAVGPRQKELFAQSQDSSSQDEEFEVNGAPAYPIYTALKEKLAKECRQIDFIRGDGNCFFRAISKQLYGSERYHKTIRGLIVDLIATNKSSFAQFVDGEDTQEHVERMCQEQSWATTCEIYAASTLLQRDIYMLTPDHLNETYSWLLFKPVFHNDAQESGVGSHPCYLTLCNTNGNHYDRIVPQHGPCNCFLPHPELDGVSYSVDLTGDS